MNSRFTTRSLLLATMFITGVMVLYLWIRPRPGVKVSIRNIGSIGMKDLVVIVTGRSYKLGDVPAGATKSCRVIPTNDSDVRVSFTLEDGVEKQQSIGCYIEPGYRGSIRVDIEDGWVKHESYRFSY